MPDHHTTSIKGEITHVFGHRIVVETSKGAVLADVTPKGLEQHQLRIGDQVELAGEMKPSELKVLKLTSGKTTIEIAHKKPHDDHPHAEPGEAIKAARKAGYEPLGEPRRKPKHFEVLGRCDDKLTELHIELDGHIRKEKPVAHGDPKWAAAL
ncbi:MAG: hypothetical protein NT113_17245 [Hyphomicrobiales bacterium]|nr:hypothetical protein [Hyphomicrobiales bacterium]